jgi:small subunit ribosomal protein S20
VANIKSQIKRNRQSEKARLRNRAVRSELRTRAKAENEAESLRLAIQRIDRAATKGVLHKNTAARQKSRLIARVRASARADES